MITHDDLVAIYAILAMRRDALLIRVKSDTYRNRREGVKTELAETSALMVVVEKEITR